MLIPYLRHFPSLEGTSFNISFKADQLLTNSLIFLLSEKVSVSPSPLKDPELLGWCVRFFFRTLSVSLHSLPAHVAPETKSV